MLQLELVETLPFTRIKELLGTAPLLLIFPVGVVLSLMEEPATVVPPSGVMKAMDGAETQLLIEICNLASPMTVHPTIHLQEEIWSASMLMV